jgi:hypothetical protein
MNTASPMSETHPASDSPWNFYFNGEPMPRWGACWGLAPISAFLKDENSFVARELDAVDRRIDHVGVVESAAPDVFIIVIQEVLTILLTHRAEIIAQLSSESPEVYPGLLEAAFHMRKLTAQQQRAFWTTGYEEDRLRLLDVMHRCQLPADDPLHMIAPHIRDEQLAIQVERDIQVRELHRLAQSGQFDKATRKRLMEVRDH